MPIIDKFTELLKLVPNEDLIAVYYRWPDDRRVKDEFERRGLPLPRSH